MVISASIASILILIAAGGVAFVVIRKFGFHKKLQGICKYYNASLSESKKFISYTANIIWHICYLPFYQFAVASFTVPHEPTPQPIPLKTKPKQNEIQKPLTIKQILENNIKPTKSEYSVLKDTDSRMHVLKFSNDIARKYNSHKIGDSKPVTLNRYFILWMVQFLFFISIINQTLLLVQPKVFSIATTIHIA